MTADDLFQLALKILLGAALTVLGGCVGVIGWFLRGLHERFEKHIEHSQSESIEVATRLANVEATTSATEKRLDRMDGKLDTLLERSMGR